MDNLPDEVLSLIFSKITSRADRNSLSTTCKHWYEVERLQAHALKIGNGLHPMKLALFKLCTRFPNLTTLYVSYFGWSSSSGKQIDDEGVALISLHCPLLTNLSLSFCCFVTDSGLASLSKCTGLQSIALNFVPRITGVGLLSFVTGCPGIKSLELVCCTYVCSAEWLEFLGAHGNLESLIIHHCRGIEEDDFAKLGYGWRSLRKFVFDVDKNNYRFARGVRSNGGRDDMHQYIDVNCDSLEIIALSNCIVSPGMGLSSVLMRCWSLTDLQLDGCIGFSDHQLIIIVERCKLLKALDIRAMEPGSSISDATLQAVGSRCSCLEKFTLYIGNITLRMAITVNGFIALIRGCSSLRELVLQGMECFNEAGMQAIARSPSLESLKFELCHQVTNEGIAFLADSKVKRLRLSRCFGVNDAGIRSLCHWGRKLELLEVLHCPRVSKECLQDVQTSLHYTQDLSWIF